jgi:segregation and condensation protein B
MAEYDQSDRGVEIREIAGGYRVATRPEYHDAVRGFVKSLKPPMKLSLQALETLAVIAYKQPVTSPEVADIRGVDSSGVLGSLISRKLVTTAGRKAVVGRPILYKTTKEFLLRFGLKDLAELPSMEEFEKMAGELAEETEPSPQLSLPTAEARQGAEDDEVAPEAISARSDEEVAAAAQATVTVTDEDEPTVESDAGAVVEPAPTPASEEALKEDE